VSDWHDHETGGRGRSRSLKMALFDTSYTTFIQTGTIRKLGCGFLFAVHGNYGRIFNRL